MPTQVPTAARHRDCPVTGCEKGVRGIKMCARHWRMVPRELRERILATWAEFDETGDADTWDAYAEARAEALLLVNRREAESCPKA